MEKSALRVVITARIFGEEKCFGPGVAMLLERVKTLCSLRAAAMDMDMAYSKAWTILKQAERGLGKKLVSTATGGRHGGGAALTREGEAILAAYRRYDAQLKAYGQALFRESFGDLLDLDEQEAEEA